MRQESKSQCQLAKTKIKTSQKAQLLAKKKRKVFEKMKIKKKARVLIEYVENKS